MTFPPAHERVGDDLVVGPVEVAWRRLAWCRAGADESMDDEIAGAMALLDYTSRIARSLPVSGQRAWLDDEFRDIDALVRAIHEHLQGADAGEDE